MILTEISNFPEDSKKKFFKSDEISRIIWLSKFCQETIEDEKAPQIRKIKNGLVAISAMGFMIAVLIHSYNYHPEYLEIIETERQEIEEAKEKAKEKERKKNEQQPR